MYLRVLDFSVCHQINYTLRLYHISIHVYSTYVIDKQCLIVIFSHIYIFNAQEKSYKSF